MAKKYHKRWLEERVVSMARKEPVVVLTGARQVGKSTLLKNLFADWRMITLDDIDLLKQAQEDPKSIITKDKLIIDEAQRAPELLQTIKQVVDETDRSCRYILSGSANLMLMHKVTESLAGRAVILNLRPFTFGEANERPPTTTIEDLFNGQPPSEKKSAIAKLQKRIINGWMPVVTLEDRNNVDALQWYEGYVTSYLERDLRQLTQIDSLADFRNLMRALALRTGQILNQTEVGRDISISQTSVHRYTNILETSFLFERLSAYSINRTKRLIKAPKPYYVDSGLAGYLAGIDERVIGEKFWSFMFETAVLHHLMVWAELQTPKSHVHYWRTVSDTEVDFVVEKGQSLLAIEVKATNTARYEHTKSLKIFMNEYPNCVAAIVVYLGDKVVELGDRIWAVPLDMLV